MKEIFEQLRDSEYTRSDKLSRRDFLNKSAKTLFALWFGSVLTSCQKLSEKFKEKNTASISWELPQEIKEIPEELVNKIELGDDILLEIFDDESHACDEKKVLKKILDEEGCKIEKFIQKLIFQSQDGKIFIINQLLPDKTLFAKGAVFRTASFNNSINFDKVIVYNSDKIKINRGNFLFLLHEIGHIYANNKMTEGENKLIRNILRAQKKVVSGELTQNEFITEFSNRERSLVLQDERNAWARAIKIFRDLRRQGIDLIPGFTSQDIKSFVHKEPLLSYILNLGVITQNPREFRKKPDNKMSGENTGNW